MTAGTCPLPSPGGTALLERGLRLCGFRKGARVADVGCGSGEAVDYIGSAFGLDAAGIDIDDSAIAEARRHGRRCCKADAAALPFASGYLDGVIFQCSFSKMERPDEAMREAARVIKTGGKALILDFFAGEREGNFSGIMGRVEFKEKIYARLEKAGLHLVHFEDCTRELREYWGQLIFDYGAEELEKIIVDCGAVVAAKCRYGLFIAEKGE